MSDDQNPIDDDNPEWTSEDFARALQTEIPPHIRAAFPKTRGPQKAPTKVPVSLRLDREAVDHFKAGGPGWQARINSAIRKAAGLKG